MERFNRIRKSIRAFQNTEEEEKKTQTKDTLNNSTNENEF